MYQMFYINGFSHRTSYYYADLQKLLLTTEKQINVL